MAKKSTTSKKPYAASSKLYSVKKVAGKRLAVIETSDGRLTVNLTPTKREAIDSLISLGVLSANGKRTRRYALTAKK